ncbi:MAG TPA: ATP-binding protein [Candidatus Acidoferrales bacterium]|jgi:signal transduction histidine kinase|nr:ATP-binding protein [Candidatus Acidoferrales bacterium]
MPRHEPTGNQSDPGPETPQGRLFTGQEISEFLFRACHDLRTPLRAIRAHAELLVKSGDLPANSGGDPRLAFIIEGAGRMDQLVNGLSAYSIALRTDPGSFVPTGLGVLLRTVLAKLDKVLRDNQAAVTYSELPRVWGDPDRLMQLLENLLLSALCHRGQISPQIHLAAATHADGWLFTFRDNGPGIEAADLERIFQPFARWEGADGAGSGLESAASGLGLAICREIVERHGGRIWAESQNGTGCAFFFTLPGDNQAG